MGTYTFIWHAVGVGVPLSVPPSDASNCSESDLDNCYREASERCSSLLCTTSYMPLWTALIAKRPASRRRATDIPRPLCAGYNSSDYNVSPLLWSGRTDLMIARV